MNKIDESYSFDALLIVIHSVDMGQLKQIESMEILSQLAACSGIRMVLSVDSCKAGVLFTD